MNNFKAIQVKLEQFIKRYYINDLIKGSILFFSIGLLYLLFTLFIEHLLWLKPVARAFLFWIFLIVELSLLVRFIVWPLSKLFKLQKGIGYEEASKLIGKHFSEVNDKLLNVLQLQRNTEPSELLLASIEQKSSELRPVNFKSAVNFKSNFKYLKYVVVPVIILLLSFVSGHFNWFSDSYDRMVNYKVAFEPPAPFEFFVINEHLKGIENKDFNLVVKTIGNVVPENAQIHYAGETYFLRQTHPGTFEYVFPSLKSEVSFQLSANQVVSKSYKLAVVNVPTLVNLEMELKFPSYLNRTDEILKSTGNMTIPEGTKVTWKIKTITTDKVAMYAQDTILFNAKGNGNFEFAKQVFSKFNYTITTSNKNLNDYENLNYSIDIIKDMTPELNIVVQRDSLDQQSLYFYGQVSDDYGISKLQLIYYPIDNEEDKIDIPIPVSTSNFDEFITSFPNNLELEEGKSYELYFQVFDNDVLHNFKSVKSNVFSYRKLTNEEEESQQLQQQGETIKNLDNSVKNLKDQEKQLEELTRSQMEKEQLTFNDRKKLQNFIKRQQQQEEMMQNFNRQLKDNLENFQQDQNTDDVMKEQLKERLKDNEAQLLKDEKLLRELEKLYDKIDKEELTDRLKQMSSQNKNKQKSLQQMLMLTKRYYVAKKSEQLQRQLEKLADDQEQLSKENPESNTSEKQQKLNEAFEDFQNDMDQLQKDNRELSKPLDIHRDKLDEQEIQEDQQNASDDLMRKEDAKQKQDYQTADKKHKDAQQKQKDASRKMKQMSSGMQQSMMSGGQEQLSEDAAMLRQILKNLLLFSFDQEDLMNQFKSIEINHNLYGSFLRKQSNLREHFSFIDDSLFTLSLRQPRLSETINSNITDVFYYIDKAMDELSENLLYQGVASQQYVMTATNNLSNVLSDILDNMESDLNFGQGEGSGKGQGQRGKSGGTQLPDIIMSQEELNKEVEDGLKKNDSSNKQDGKGKQDGEGKNGENGNSRTDENEGSVGSSGSNGDGSSEEMNGELYRIYQQQQELRKALEERLNQMGISPEGQQILKQMENVESDLINSGFTNQTLQRMMNLQQQLLKLQNATYLQEEDQKRESNTNNKQFDNLTNDQLPNAKKYFDTIEILNRQTLPLQNIYRKKVQGYFRNGDN
ncbi:MAG TPA: hypothetical protein VNJ50_08925 [Gelidibacter sp.]|uniref:hypothetical protein n=1 Tax=Gelidibacter sp. TaxID=2018083 RepID=UPI002B97B290|nr:hypothetical protein [Gelidibacter sp.]HXJ98956.1 hypothetical protein [Gelidibacter sp.]